MSNNNNYNNNNNGAMGTATPVDALQQQLLQICQQMKLHEERQQQQQQQMEQLQQHHYQHQQPLAGFASSTPLSSYGTSHLPHQSPRPMSNQQHTPQQQSQPIASSSNDRRTSTVTRRQPPSRPSTHQGQLQPSQQHRTGKGRARAGWSRREGEDQLPGGVTHHHHGGRRRRGSELRARKRSSRKGGNCSYAMHELTSLFFPEARLSFSSLPSLSSDASADGGQFPSSSSTFGSSSSSSSSASGGRQYEASPTASRDGYQSTSANRVRTGGDLRYEYESGSGEYRHPNPRGRSSSSSTSGGRQQGNRNRSDSHESSSANRQHNHSADQDDDEANGEDDDSNSSQHTPRSSSRPFTPRPSDLTRASSSAASNAANSPSSSGRPSRRTRPAVRAAIASSTHTRMDCSPQLLASAAVASSSSSSVAPSAPAGNGRSIAPVPASSSNCTQLVVYKKSGVDSGGVGGSRNDSASMLTLRRRQQSHHINHIEQGDVTMAEPESDGRSLTQSKEDRRRKRKLDESSESYRASASAVAVAHPPSRHSSATLYRSIITGAHPSFGMQLLRIGDAHLSLSSPTLQQARYGTPRQLLGFSVPPSRHQRIHVHTMSACYTNDATLAVQTPPSNSPPQSAAAPSSSSPEPAATSATSATSAAMYTSSAPASAAAPSFSSMSTEAGSTASRTYSTSLPMCVDSQSPNPVGEGLEVDSYDAQDSAEQPTAPAAAAVVVLDDSPPSSSPQPQPTDPAASSSAPSDAAPPSPEAHSRPISMVSCFPFLYEKADPIVVGEFNSMFTRLSKQLLSCNGDERQLNALHCHFLVLGFSMDPYAEQLLRPGDANVRCYDEPADRSEYTPLLYAESLRLISSGDYDHEHRVGSAMRETLVVWIHGVENIDPKDTHQVRDGQSNILIVRRLIAACRSMGADVGEWCDRIQQSILRSVASQEQYAKELDTYVSTVWREAVEVEEDTMEWIRLKRIFWAAQADTKLYHYIYPPPSPGTTWPQRQADGASSASLVPHYLGLPLSSLCAPTSLTRSRSPPPFFYIPTFHSLAPSRFVDPGSKIKYDLPDVFLDFEFDLYSALDSAFKTGDQRCIAEASEAFAVAGYAMLQSINAKSASEFRTTYPRIERLIQELRGSATQASVKQQIAEIEKEITSSLNRQFAQSNPIRADVVAVLSDWSRDAIALQYRRASESRSTAEILRAADASLPLPPPALKPSSGGGAGAQRGNNASRGSGGGGAWPPPPQSTPSRSISSSNVGSTSSSSPFSSAAAPSSASSSAATSTDPRRRAAPSSSSSMVDPHADFSYGSNRMYRPGRPTSTRIPAQLYSSSESATDRSSTNISRIMLDRTTASPDDEEDMDGDTRDGQNEDEDGQSHDGDYEEDEQ